MSDRTPQLGTLGLNLLITTRIFVDRINDLNTPFEGGSDEDFQVRMFVCMHIFAAVCVTALVCVRLPHCMFSRCYIHPSCLSVGCLYRFG